MHEYPITQRIIEIADEYAVKNNVSEVKVINLVVGDYSGYVASSIELYFEIIAEGSACEKAKLHIERIVPKLKCSSCGNLFIRKRRLEPVQSRSNRTEANTRREMGCSGRRAGSALLGSGG